VKTGYTKKSGRCLVGAAIRDGLTLITVTLDAPDDWNDHINMLEYGFSVRQKLLVLGKDEINLSVPVICGNKESVTLTNSEPVYVITPLTKKAITQDIVIPKYVIAPISTGDALGEVSFYLDDLKIATTSLSAKETIKYKNKK
ncbi:MAG: D-alanyl-D-alanine carboxypeptidase, partial [Clostridia bacterium]|nr:D-alanyl-D-alanine carboxypeptidase [Clostridia bacterium]